MPKLLRFMSANEAMKLMIGETLHNETDHRQAGNVTSSVGFCFAVLSGVESEEAAIYHASKRLSGITLLEVCLVGTLKKAQKFKKSTGRYTSGEELEMCATKYSLESFSEWRMYCPTERNSLLVAFSWNWMKPEYIACNQDMS